MEDDAGGGDDGGGGLIYVQGRGEGIDGDHNYRCTIDPSTGNLLMIEDVGGGAFIQGHHNHEFESAVGATDDDGGHGNGEVGNGNEGPGPAGAGELLTVVRVLETGEYVFESFDSLHAFQQQQQEQPGAKPEPGGGSGNEDDDDGGSEQGEELREEELIDVDYSGSQSRGEIPVVPESKDSLWTRRKIFDLISCIQNHEQKFRKWPKIMSVWNVVSGDMRELGYSNCNKDECSKKWSNLHRTWRTVRMRPKGSRSKWTYYDVVSNVLKSLYSRHRETVSQMTSNPITRSSTRELMLRLMTTTKQHQHAILAAEERFKSKVNRLDEERDKILCDIKEILQCR